MVFVFGACLGLMVGVLVGAVIGGGSSNRNYRNEERDYYSSRYLNNPVVRELNEQEKTRNIP